MTRMSSFRILGRIGMSRRSWTKHQNEMEVECFFYVREEMIRGESRQRLEIKFTYLLKVKMSLSSS